MKFSLLNRMIYRGSIITPLAAEHTEESMDNNVKFTGDFAKPEFRQIIFSRKNRYSFTIELKDPKGETLDLVECAVPDDYLTVDEMRELAKTLIMEQIDECQADVIDLTKSTLTISLLDKK